MPGQQSHRDHAYDSVLAYPFSSEHLSLFSSVPFLWSLFGDYYPQ